MKDFIKKYKHAWILSYFAIYILWFTYLEKTVTKEINIIHMSIDNYIPFCEYFIIPYLLWFAYVAVGVLYFFFTDVSDYYKLCCVLYVGMTVFLIVSTIYPNGHYLRPSVYENNIFNTLVQWLHGTDTSTNILPSIHVYNSLAVHMAVARNKKLRQYKWVQTGSLILAVSIVLSTVFLKQHSVLDVITGCMLAAVMYGLVYGRGFQFNRKKEYKGKLQKISF